MLPIGTLVNVVAVLVGGAAGTLAHGRLPDRYRAVVFQGLGLCTLVIGMQMALKTPDPLALIFSVVLGGVTGELLRLEDRLTGVAERLKRKVGSQGDGFVDGMVTAFLIFCVGPMTILGAFDEGLRGDPTLLLTKAMLDGFAAVALASTYGIGVCFSAIPLALYQLALTVFAVWLQALFGETAVAALTGAGGALILGIGLTLLELTRVRVANFLPALLYVVLLTWLLT